MTRAERAKRRKRILDTYARTGGIRKTTRELGISIHVVRRVLRGLDHDVPMVSERSPRPSKLDPFKPLATRLVQEDGLTAVLVLEELRALGFDGGYSIVKSFVRTVRPAPKRRPTTVMEHPPGAEAQVDWSPCRVRLGDQWTEVSCFSMVLPHSRWMFIRFRLDEKLETLIALHDEAFAALGGVPVLMTYDNMTTVGRHVGPDQIKLSQRFEAYAKACGFEIALITPGRPNEHASVERPFHYVQNNCLRRRRSRFEDFDDLQAHAKWWCDEIANVRVHGTTRERPVDRVQRERAYLLPLPWHRAEAYRDVARLVREDFCVALDTNHYSVPPRYVGQPATVRVYADRIEIVVARQIVAVHRLDERKYQRNVLPEHEEAFKRQTPSRRLLEQAFVRLGPVARTYYEGLCAQRGRGAGYHLQRILKLADRYGAEAVCGAMAHASRYGSYGADAVARVLTGREPGGVAPPRQQGESPPPSERVRQWLEAMHVEGSDLADYDRLVDEADVGPPPEEDEDDES